MPRIRHGYTVKPIPICLSRQKIPTEREVKIFTSEQFLNFNRPDFHSHVQIITYEPLNKGVA